MELCKALWGEYTDVGGRSQEVCGSMTKLRSNVTVFSIAARKLLNSIVHTSFVGLVHRRLGGSCALIRTRTRYATVCPASSLSLRTKRTPYRWFVNHALEDAILCTRKAQIRSGRGSVVVNSRVSRRRVRTT